MYLNSNKVDEGNSTLNSSSEVDTFIEEVFNHITNRFTPYDAAEIAAKMRVRVITALKDTVVSKETGIKELSGDIENLSTAIHGLSNEYIEAKSNDYDREIRRNNTPTFR